MSIGLDTAQLDNINTLSGANISEQQNTLNQTFEDFVLLLTTQLEQQDPTEPLDTSQVTEQIASLSQVQAQNDTNSRLDQLIALSSGTQLDSVVGYIGRVVEAPGNTSPLLTNGQQDGAVFTYDLPEQAASANINIFNQAGSLVFSGPALNLQGRNEVVWDGVNSLTGNQEPLGPYTFTVNAEDSDGNPIDATTFTNGIATAVETEGGGVVISLGPDIEISLNDVTSVRAAQ